MTALWWVFAIVVLVLIGSMVWDERRYWKRQDEINREHWEDLDRRRIGL